MPRGERELRCYKCNQRVTSKDNIQFLATMPYHAERCPTRKRKRKKVEEENHAKG